MAWIERTGIVFTLSEPENHSVPAEQVDEFLTHLGHISINIDEKWLVGVIDAIEQDDTFLITCETSDGPPAKIERLLRDAIDKTWEHFATWQIPATPTPEPEPEPADVIHQLYKNQVITFGERELLLDAIRPAKVGD